MTDHINTTELLCQASQATSLQELVNLAYIILRNPVFIEDRSYIILAYSNNVEIDETEWNTAVKKASKKAPRNRQINEMETAYAQAKKNHLPFIVSDDHLPFPRLIKPLILKGAHIGTMVTTGYCSPINETDIKLMEILSVIALSIMRDDQYMISSNHDALDNFFIRLLMGNHMPANDVKDKVDSVRWNSKPFHFIMVLCPLELGSIQSMPLYDILEGTRQQINCRSLIFDSRIICICNLNSSVDDWEIEFPVLTSVLQQYNLIAGVSQSFENPALMSAYYKQAKSTAEIGGVLKNKILYYSYNDVSVYFLLDTLARQVDLRLFCHEKILLLEKHDTAHNTELVPTLHAYLESQCSISKTAKRIYIHRNTVTYRINKCFEILESKLDCADEFFACIFSLRIIEYVNKKAGKPSPY